MDILEAKQHTLIIEKAKELTQLLEWGPDIRLINALIREYKSSLDKFNIECYDVVDPTSDDLRQYKINRKKWIYYEYGKTPEITILINNMSIEYDSFNMYTLLRRKNHSRSFYADNNSAFYKLYDTLKETIKNTILKEFLETNKESLSEIKYIEGCN